MTLYPNQLTYIAEVLASLSQTSIPSTDKDSILKLQILVTDSEQDNRVIGTLQQDDKDQWQLSV